MGLFDKLQSKLELYRLEQKYAKRRNRTTFTTGAQYVDGEYVYATDAIPASQPFSASMLNVSSPASTNTTGSWGSHTVSKRRSMIWPSRKS